MKSRESAYSARSAGSEAVVNPADPYPYTLLGVLEQLIESPAPFKAVRLEIDGGQVEEPDAEGRNE